MFACSVQDIGSKLKDKFRLNHDEFMFSPHARNIEVSYVYSLEGVSLLSAWRRVLTECMREGVSLLSACVKACPY